MIDINELIKAEMMIGTIRQKQENVEKNTNIIKNIKYKTTQKRRNRLDARYWLSVFALYIISVVLIVLLLGDVMLHFIGDEEPLISLICFVCVISGLPMLIISALSYHFVVYKVFYRREEKRSLTPEEQELHNECREAISKSRSVIDGVREQLKLCPIPKKYLNGYILRWMIDAVRNQRADTNKELYNLYEQFAAEERRHKEQVDAIDNITIHNEYNYWG